MLISLIGVYCCSSRCNSCNNMGAFPERNCWLSTPGWWNTAVSRSYPSLGRCPVHRHWVHSTWHRFRLHEALQSESGSSRQSEHWSVCAISIGAAGFPGRILPFGNLPRIESVGREKANALVLPFLTLCSFSPSPLILYSIPLCIGFAIRYRTDIPVCHQHPHMPINKSSNKWRNVRNTIHAPLRDHDMGFLVKYNGGWLANACVFGNFYIAAVVPPQ